ncbi:MAG: hypothetical protein RIR90_2080 [Bacteroidota bacterium]|jgi:hypothetical protein
MKSVEKHPDFTLEFPPDSATFAANLTQHIWQVN